MTQITHAKPVKLSNGNWGCKVQGGVAEGDVVRVTTQAGASWEARLLKVNYREVDDVSICTCERVRFGGQSAVRKSQRPKVKSWYCWHVCPVGGYKCCPENGQCHDCS